MGKTEQKSLYELRKAHGISQVGVAACLGVNINTYIGWERGVANPSPDNEAKLDALFGKGKWRTGL